jgi:hypothetical protein
LNLCAFLGVFRFARMPGAPAARRFALGRNGDVSGPDIRSPHRKGETSTGMT